MRRDLQYALRGLPFAIALVLGLSVRSSADTIYSNLGPGLTYGTVSWGVGGPLPTIRQAVAFCASAEYAVTEIDLALDSSTDFPTVVEIRTDAGGVPGDVVASWTMSSLPAPHVTFPPSIVPSQTITGITDVTLAGRTTYWLAIRFVQPDIAFSTDTWWANSTGQTSPMVYSLDDGLTWVHAVAVPTVLQRLNIRRRPTPHSRREPTP
jgi:hypothetical protein